jgi:hypothetical protein
MRSQSLTGSLAQARSWIERHFFQIEADTLRRCTLLASAILLQGALDLPRDQLTVIFGPKIGLLPMAVLAGSIALTIFALTSPKVPPGQVMRRGWTIALLALCLVAGVLGVKQVGVAVYKSFTPTVYANDGTILDQYAALDLLRGHDPYQSVNIVAAIHELNQSFIFVTPLRLGRFANRSWLAYPSYDEIRPIMRAANPQQPPPPEVESRVSYPALAFLWLTPFVAVGLPSVVLFALLCLALFAWLALRAVQPALRPWLAVLIVIDLPIINGVLTGILDITTMLLLVGAWLAWRQARWSAVLLGLAIATKQQPWFFVPFYALFIGFGGLAGVPGKLYGTWATWRDAALRLAGAVAIFFAINLPFMLHDLHAWLAGVLAPVSDPMFPRGPGLVQLALAGIAPLWPQRVYTVLELLGILAAIAWYAWRGARQHPEMAFVLALLPLWLSWRSLPTYFYFATLPAAMLWLAWRGNGAMPSVAGANEQRRDGEEHGRTASPPSRDERRRITPRMRVRRFVAPRPPERSAPLARNNSWALRDVIGQWSVLATRWGMPLVWGLWGLTTAQMLANLILGHHYADPQFYQYAGDFAVGRLPYRDVAVEYPPLAILVMLLPALPLLPFAGIAPRPELNPHPLHPDPVRYAAYGISFGIVMLLLDALTLWLVLRAARRWLPGDARGVGSGLLYVALMFGSGAVLQKFDLTMGALCLVAVLALLAERDGLAWAALVGATLLKGFPILIAPLFILWRVSAGRVNWAALRRGAVRAGIAAVVVLGPTLALGGIAPLVHSVAYHTSRGVEIESVPATIMLALAWLPGLAVYTTFDFADLSRDVHSPLAGTLDVAALIALVGLVLALYALFWYNVRKSSPQWLLGGATMALLIFMLCFRALPLHYLLGIVPLAALIRLPPPWQWRWVAALLLCCVAGQVAITFWHQVVALEPGFVLALIARNGLLIAASAILVRGCSVASTLGKDEGGKL